MLGVYNQESLDELIAEPFISTKLPKDWVKYDEGKRIETEYKIKTLSEVGGYLSGLPNDSWAKYISGSEELIIMKNPEGRVRVLYRKGKLKDTSFFPMVIADTLSKNMKYTVEAAIWNHRRVVNKNSL